MFCVSQSYRYSIRLRQLCRNGHKIHMHKIEWQNCVRSSIFAVSLLFHCVKSYAYFFFSLVSGDDWTNKFEACVTSGIWMCHTVARHISNHTYVCLSMGIHFFFMHIHNFPGRSTFLMWLPVSLSLLFPPHLQNLLFIFQRYLAYTIRALARSWIIALNQNCIKLNRWTNATSWQPLIWLLHACPCNTHRNRTYFILFPSRDGKNQNSNRIRCDFFFFFILLSIVFFLLLPM